MSKEIGTLVVVVLKARNLRDKHTIHKQDVYAQVTLNKDTKKTKTEVRGGQHPVWDEELRFPIFKDASDETRKLEVACYSKEPRQDDLIGQGSLDITITLKTGEFDDWVPLKTEEGGYRGDLFLEMTYYSAAPPPLQRRASKWKPAERLTRPTSNYTYPVTSPAEGGTAPNSHTSPPAVKHEALPPLPEEVASTPFIPASLRPGGAGSSKTSPKAGTGLLPPEHPIHTQALPRDPSPPAPSRDPLPIPSLLRPGGGAPHPRARTQSHSQPPAPAYNSPALPAPSIPEPQIPALDNPYNPPPPRQPFGEYGSPPRHPYPEYSPAPPARPVSYAGDYSAPPARPLSYAGDYSAPPPLFPQVPQIPPQPYPQYPPTPYGGGGYPPLSYGPPPPVPQPPPPSSFDLPDPFLQKRYQSPLPLPEGARPSQPQPKSQAKSQSKTQAQTQTQPQPPPKHPASTSTSTAASTPAVPAKKAEPVQAKPKGPSREERDRQLALEFEKEEAERQRKLREQEERDMELARQLDMELNLDGEGGGGGAAAESRPSAAAGATAAMPGEW